MNFSKLSLISVATAGALAMAGQALAFVPNWTNDKDAADGTDNGPNGTIALWHAGASASTASMQNAVLQAVCDPAQPIDILEDARSYATAPTATTAGVANPAFWTVACKVKAGITGFTAGTQVMWSKRDEGGSGVGVGPLVLGTSIAFMKPSTGTGNNCPGDGTTNSAGFTINNYSRSVLGGATATVWNCINFTYKLTGPATPAVVSENAVDDDAVSRIPDIGGSDIEPEKFASFLLENNPKADFDLNTTTETLPTYDPSAYFTATNSSPVAYLTFGVPVNLLMYQDLQKAQFPTGHPLFDKCNPGGTLYSSDKDGVTGVHAGGIADSRNFANAEECMPNLTANEIRSIYSSTAAIKNSTDMQAETLYNDKTTMAAITASAPANSNIIQICRRVHGSGTQAQANAIWMGYPCDLTSDGSIDSLIMTFDGQLGANTIENEGSGDVEKCLDDFSNGTNGTGRNTALNHRWSVGIQSLEKNAPSSTTFTFAHAYRFIKVDGFAPSIANVHAGDYYDFAAQNLQYRVEQPAIAADAYAALKVILTDPTKLPSLNKTQTFGVSGWLAIPSSTSKPDPQVDLTKPISWYRRAAANGKFNTCALPSMFNAKGGAVVNNSATVGPQNCASTTVGGLDNNCYTNPNP
jgi:hypothetical protein